MISTLKEVREALNALCAKLPKPDGFAYPNYFAKNELEAAAVAITKLDALIEREKAEPVGEVRAKSDAYGGTFVHWKKLPVAGMALYTAPQSAPSTSTAMTDDAVTPEYLAWLASLQPPRNGVGGNEAWNAGVAFAGQQLAHQSAPSTGPLTDEELQEIFSGISGFQQWALTKPQVAFARAIEAAHGIGAKP